MGEGRSPGAEGPRHHRSRGGTSRTLEAIPCGAAPRPPRGSSRSLAEALPARSPPPAANYPPCWLRARRGARQRRGRRAGGRAGEERGGRRERGRMEEGEAGRRRQPRAPAPAEPWWWWWRRRRQDKGGWGAALQMEMNPRRRTGELDGWSPLALRF